jgi:hypothetical protein
MRLEIRGRGLLPPRPLLVGSFKRPQNAPEPTNLLVQRVGIDHRLPIHLRHVTAGLLLYGSPIGSIAPKYGSSVEAARDHTRNNAGRGAGRGASIGEALTTV